MIDRIVGHEDHPEGRLYRVPWYGYRPDEDTLEPASHIPANFVPRYEQRSRRD